MDRCHRGEAWVLTTTRVADSATRRDRVRDPGVAADDCTATDDRLSPEDRRVSVDEDIVFDGWVSLAVLLLAGFPCR